MACEYGNWVYGMFIFSILLFLICFYFWESVYFSMGWFIGTWKLGLVNYIFFTFLLLLFMEKFDFFFLFSFVCVSFVQVGRSMDMEIGFNGFFLQVHIFESVISYAIENYIGLVFYLFCSFFCLPFQDQGEDLGT